MSEYIIEIPDEYFASYDTERDMYYPDERDSAMPITPIVRCRDCKHATISNLGRVKYCEMFVLPDKDGYGADPQVNLPLDFFCAYGERMEE